MVEGGETCSGDISCDAGFESRFPWLIDASPLLGSHRSAISDASVALGFNAVSAGEECDGVMSH